ncbi:hypothetical protein Slala02_45960 [Streptomyces lavendulae subsp. lavendulae]|nr:hypothetical protein Slala01_19420 [Streptomyces lavendulae subsp. lavendulae]GLX28776.1 hypothetical protein Slala02_45960 [Streptomyces lavendulae subsp. lavendulae]
MPSKTLNTPLTAIRTPAKVEPPVAQAFGEVLPGVVVMSPPSCCGEPVVPSLRARGGAGDPEGAERVNGTAPGPDAGTPPAPRAAGAGGVPVRAVRTVCACGPQAQSWPWRTSMASSVVAAV